MERELFSGAARDAHQQGQAEFFAAMENDLLLEPVQVRLITHGAAGMSGPRATADSKAGPMRAASLTEVAAGEEFPAVFPDMMKEVVPVAMEGDSMVEDVVNRKPLQ
jgi:hypothetical protein